MPVDRYRELPAVCFEPVDSVVIEREGINRELAEAYRGNLSAAVDQAKVLACCQVLSHGQQCDLREVTQ